MSHAKQHYMPWISACITVANVSESLKFYESAFGFKPLGESIHNEIGIPVYAMMSYQDGMIQICAQDAFGNPSKTPRNTGVESPMLLYVYVDNVDHHFENAVRAGAHLIRQPEDMFWGDRMSQLKDPDGYHWSFATAVTQQQS